MAASLLVLTVLLLIPKNSGRQDSLDDPNPTKKLLLVVSIFLIPTIAVLIAQIIRGELKWEDYDSPSRLLFGMLVFINLTKLREVEVQKVQSAVSTGLCLALLTLPIAVSESSRQRWGGRFATTLSDPNTLGSFVGLFMVLLLCQIVFQNPLKLRKYTIIHLGWLLTRVVAMGCGLWALIGSQSRAAWAATAVTGLLVVGLFVGDVIRHRQSLGSYWLRLLILFMLLIVLGALAPILSIDGTSNRFQSIFLQISNALSDKNFHDQQSISIRFEMYMVGLEIFLSNFLSGYGDLNYRFVLESEQFLSRYHTETLELFVSAGPHSELLARALQSGIWGLFGAITLFCLPGYIFWRNKQGDPSRTGQVANKCGVIFTTYVILIQFSIEFSLKYVSSFYGYILAVLLATSIKSYASNAQQPTKNY